jgi:hypothetical protein
MSRTPIIAPPRPAAAAPPAALGGGNRRRSDRFPHVAESWVSTELPDGTTERTEVTSVNLSRHGVAFQLAHPLAAGAFYTIEIGLGPQQLVAEVRTISCRATQDGRYEIGAEFS